MIWFCFVFLFSQVERSTAPKPQEEFTGMMGNLARALDERHKVMHSSGKHVTLLYSWRFSRYSASFHWLVHGHMTSNNETVSRQMPWAGNIAKAMTSNGKQFTVTRSTVHCWPLLHAMAGISARFSNFAFVLFCYIANHLMTGPLGNSH